MNISKNILNIIKEEACLFFEEFVYQVRYIDGPIFYKKKRMEKLWKFTNKEDFLKNCNKENFVKWNSPFEDSSEMPYKEEYEKENIYIRTFSENVDPKELTWHKDKEDRIVEPMHITDWKFQYDNELPIDLSNPIKIKKESYHRIIKGSGSLKVRIKKIK